MAGGFKMEFVADVAKFIRGTKDVERALDDVSGSLDDLARDAQQSADKTGEAFDDAGREISDGMDTATKDAGQSLEKVGDDAKDSAKDVDTAAEKMERSFRDAFDAVKKDSKDAGDSVGKNVSDGLDKASVAADDVKEEISSSAREGAASFTGEFDDIGDFLQEVLANAAQGLGPAAGALGIAAALGAGVLLQKYQENTEKVKETVSAMYEDLVESGNKYLSESYVQDAVKELADDEGQFAKAQELAASTGAELSTVLRALVGDKESLATVSDDLAAASDRERQAAADLREEADKVQVTDSARADELRREATDRETVASALDTQRESLSGVNDQYDKALEKADAVRGARVSDAEAIQALIAAEGDYQAAITAATEAAAANGATLDANTAQGQANRAAMLELVDAGEEYIQNLKDSGATSSVVTAAQNTLRDSVVKAAGQFGITGQAAEDYADKILGIPKSANTEVTADTRQAQEDLNTFLANARSQQIRIQARVDADPNYNPATAPSQIRRARGGVIPGMPSSSDNLRADVASGEFIVNADATAKNRQLLDAINQGRQPVLPGGPGGQTSVSLEGANITIEVDGTSFRGYVRQQARLEATSAIRTSQARRRTR